MSVRIVLPATLLAASLLPACAVKNTGEVAGLMAEVAALRARVDELETFRQRVEMAVELPGDPEEEMAALNLAYEARDLMVAGDNEEALVLLQKIVAEYPDTQVGPAAQEMLRELRVVGSDAGSLDVQAWIQGEHTLDPKALTVVVFFEAWCPHCQREMPNLQATFTALDDKGLDVVGMTNLSRGTTPEQMRTFLDETGVTFAVGRDDGSLSQRFAANGVPHSAVVRGGKVEWIGHPAELTQERLSAWLGE